MEHEAAALFNSLQESAFAASVRQSVWIYPAANIGHIVALVCFAGAIAIMDFRLLGGMRHCAPAQLIGRARWYAAIALIGLITTGFILFSAEAGHVVANPVFQAKMALIAAGFINILVYEFGAKRAVQAVPPGAALPRSAFLAGIFSLTIWITVAALGRLIAYV